MRVESDDERTDVIRPYSNTELPDHKPDFFNIDAAQAKVEAKNIFYQDSLRSAIQVVIERLDDKIFDSEEGSGKQFSKTK